VSTERIPPMFIADAPGLDFLNSIANPVDTEVEWLANGQDFLAWLEDAGHVSAQVAAQFRASAKRGGLDAVAAEARELREWFRQFVLKNKGSALGADALKQLKPLNGLLERDAAFSQIVINDPALPHAGPEELALQVSRHWNAPEALLQPLAQTMAELVCAEDFSRIKACEGPTCSLLFIDRTRGQARRWCSMAQCGNRAKQAAHRARVRQD
jgi:predicted RNA-binding Zn ribbon-like protein